MDFPSCTKGQNITLCFLYKEKASLGLEIGTINALNIIYVFTFYFNLIFIYQEIFMRFNYLKLLHIIKIFN